jgi:multidrug efflux pump subunit AcrB
MEEGVTIKIEEALKGIAEIDELSSVSSENSARISIVAFQNVDMDALLAEVKNSVDGISSFPTGAEKPIIFKQKTAGMAGGASRMALIGDVDLMTLKVAAQEIERDLLNTGQISEITMQGFPPIEYSIEVNENQLLRYNLTFDDIVSAVRANNRDISAGTIKTTEEEFLIRLKSKYTDPYQIGNHIVRAGESGEIIRLSDVADVKFQFSDVANKSFIDGKRAVNFNINRRYGEDLRVISGIVKNYIEEYNASHVDLQIIETFSFFDMLNERIDLLTKNGVLGLVLVLIVLGMFLNIKLSAWVAFGIPFSFLGMFALGSFLGVTVNMISLFGMILVVGILVDDGIVIAENIFAHFEKGKSSYRAAIDGTMEVLPSVLSSVLTTIIAFSVLLFIEGMERMAEMALVVILALSFSLIEAFLILPAHLSSRSVLKESNVGRFRKAINKFVAYMRDDVYRSLLDLTIKYYRIAVFFPLIFVVFVVYLLKIGLIHTTFFPSIPFDDFTVEIAYKPGEPIEKTEEFLSYAEAQIKIVQQELNEKYGWDLISYVSKNVGTTRNLGESGTHCGSITVSLDVEKAEISSFEVAKLVRDKIGIVKGSEKYMVGGINRWGKPVSISLAGEDYNELKKASRYLREQMAKMSELKDIQDNSSSGKREIIMELKPKAYMLGLTQNEIARQVRQGFFGEEAQRLIVGRDEARVWIRYPESDRESIGQYENMRIKTKQGQQIPLAELVDYKIERGDVAIHHYDGIKEVEITADQSDPFASTPEIIADIKSGPIQDMLKNYSGVNISFRGQSRNANKSMTSMQILLGMAIFMIALVLTLNFNSFYQARIILTILPIGLISAILGHGLEGHPVSVLSAWGMIALLGIVINDAVVFVQKYNFSLLEGMTVKEAAIDAGLSRFRPIILTSITTIAGLYPLIKEPSFQAQFLIPMAISVAYGVLFGTYFILVFLPSLILFFNDLKRWRLNFWHDKKFTPEEVEPVMEYQKRIETISKL